MNHTEFIGCTFSKERLAEKWGGNKKKNSKMGEKATQLTFYVPFLDKQQKKDGM